MRIAILLISESIYGCNVRALSARMKSRGHDVKLLFVTDRADSALCGRVAGEIRNLAPDIVGLSVMTDVAPASRAISAAIRGAVSSPVVWGGVHTGIDTRDCLESADYAFIGEADDTFPEFAESFRPGQPFESDGVVSRWDPEGRAPVFSAPVQDIDLLPFQDLDWDDHLIFAGGKVFTDQGREEAMLGYAAQAMMSRGCPYNCTFCYNNYLRDAAKGKGRYFREMSVGRIIAELEYAKGRFGDMRRVNFWDDNFLSRKREEIEEFAALYKERIGLPFQLLANPLNISREKLLAMKAAGMDTIQVGLQSGSERTNREIYRRPVSREKTVQMFHLLHDLGLKAVCYDLIFNNPYESVENVKETIETVLEISPPYIFFGFNLFFFPGTELYKRALADGLISGRKEGAALDDPIFEHENSPIHAPLTNKPSSKLYDVHYDVGEKRYYNLLLFLVTGTRLVPHSLVRYLLRHRNALTEPVPALLARVVVFLRKIRRVLR